MYNLIFSQIFFFCLFAVVISVNFLQHEFEQEKTAQPKQNSSLKQCFIRVFLRGASKKHLKSFLYWKFKCTYVTRSPVFSA